MAADTSLLLLINGLLMYSIVGASDWNQPFFKPPPENENVSFNYNPSDNNNIIVYVKEESDDLTIAFINFDDSAIEPTKSSESPPNVLITYDEEEKLWAIQVKTGFDVEEIGEKTMNFGVFIKEEGHRVSLIVQNINDNRPTFINPDRTCKIYENTMNVPDNCSITIQDLDNDAENATVKLESQIFTLTQADSCSTGCPEKTFKLNLKQALDFETAALHTLIINTLDPEFVDYVGSINYIIQVIDEPDKPPQWSTIYSSLEVTENNDMSINITATDGDLDVKAEINYKIEIDDSFKDYIGIDESTGLFTIKEMDRETLNSDFISLKIIAFEKEDVSSAIEQSVIIVVKDENDNIPTFSITDISVTLEEVSTGTIKIENVTIKDPDTASYGQFSIKLEQSEFSEAFLVVPSQGYQSVDITLSIRNPNLLDFENEDWRNFDLKITATEDSDTTHTGSAIIHVTLTDINDEWPIFSPETYQVTLPENSPVGTFVVQVSATDKDEEDKTLDYKVIPSRGFIIDTTGTITIDNEMALDYEQSIEMHLQISANDLVKHYKYAEVVITVTDVNDVPPVLEPEQYQVDIEEKSEKNKKIVNLSARDVDTDADLEINIDWTQTIATRRGAKLQSNELYKDCIIFQQSTKSGKEISGSLIVSDSEKLDWYNLDTLSLLVVVKDKNTAESYSDKHQLFITINIKDRNDNPPEFITKPDQEFSVLENQPKTLIGTIVATDKDGEGNNNIIFSITCKDATMEGLVEIDPINGELRTVDGIDCEQFSELHYTVKASDGVSETPLDIKIVITDTNDETPVFNEHDASYKIKENSPSGLLIATIDATDADVKEEYRTLYYDLDRINNDNGLYLAVNTSTGEVTVNLTEGKELNREDPKLASFLVTIIVRDNFENFIESNSKQNKTSFTLILEDENDETPTFDVPDGCFPTNPVFESILNGSEIAIVEATDADDPQTDNSKISYEIISSVRQEQVLDNCKDIFSITTDESSNTGTISAIKDLIGCWGTYETVIEATDKGNIPLSSTGTYTICIYDVNDNSPIWFFPTEGNHIRIREVQTVSSRLLSDSGDPPYPVDDLNATDIDDGENGRISFSLEGNSDFFEIGTDNKGNFITLKQDLSKAENKSRFDLVLTAKDNGTIPISTPINVQIVVFITVPVDPIFTTDCTLEFPENNENGFQIIPKAYDENNQNVEDENDLQPIYYFIVSGEDSELFNIDKTSGNVTLTRPLDREEGPNRTLYIVATNIDRLPDDINKDSDSVLKCDVHILDVNDEPPIFSAASLVSGFAVDDDLDSEILKLQAIDNDENDVVKYKLNSVNGSTPDLQQFEDKAFYMNEDGSIRLAFQPTNKKIQGFFTLSVSAFDSLGDVEGHRSSAYAKIFIISDANRVTFQFNNPLAYVNETKLQIEDTFREGFNYTCGVDKITSTLDSNGIAEDNSTDVVAHFIDADNELPIDKQKISQKFYEQTTFNNLKTMFWGRYSLDLKNFIDGSSVAIQNMEQILQITLISVSVVLGSMLIILFIAFYLRTKALNRRLQALSTTKFGSIDSNLNRIGVTVPNTNKHAVEGSNPVYGGVERPDYDAISQGSGGSALIGIEDKPEFQSNYLTSGHYMSGGLGSRENYNENLDFEFERPDTKPVTQL